MEIKEPEQVYNRLLEEIRAFRDWRETIKEVFRRIDQSLDWLHNDINEIRNDVERKATEENFIRLKEKVKECRIRCETEFDKKAPDCDFADLKAEVNEIDKRVTVIEDAKKITKAKIATVILIVSVVLSVASGMNFFLDSQACRALLKIIIAGFGAE